jgi:PAS domain S-box-containing protein
MEDEGRTPLGIKELEEILDHLNIGISIHNIDGDILEANSALGRLLEMTPEQIIGNKCHKIFHLKDSFIMNCPMKGSIQSKKPEESEFHLPQVERWLSFKTIPVLDEAEEVNRVLHIVRDITEQKDMEAAYEDIKMLDKMKEELVTNVSHELRTPLQVVEAALELISDDIEDEGNRELADRATENLYRLNNLIGDIMSAVKLREQMLPSQEIIDVERSVNQTLIPVEVIERKPVDIVKLLKKCAKSFSSQIETDELKVEYRIEDDIQKILGDEKELGMAFSNIISNAIKFNDKGGSISFDVQNSGDKVVVKIKDTGIGIPQDKLPKIFDRFYQIDGSTTRKFEGTGLGLYLVKSYIERHGGNIWAESTQGEGTTLILVLPSM